MPKFKELRLWEKKLDYLRDRYTEWVNIDRYWFGPDQWDRFYENKRSLEVKIAEYERLVEYLKSFEEAEVNDYREKDLGFNQEQETES